MMNYKITEVKKRGEEKTIKKRLYTIMMQGKQHHPLPLYQGAAELSCEVILELPGKASGCQVSYSQCRLLFPVRRDWGGHRSHIAWNTVGLFFSQCTISRSIKVLFKTASSIGLPNTLGELLNDHIRSFGHGLWGCFSWRDKVSCSTTHRTIATSNGFLKFR